jgi:hypothetical protein
MNGSDTMVINNIAAIINTMFTARNRSIIASGNDPLIPYNGCAYRKPCTSAPQSKQMALRHKILVPGNPIHLAVSPLPSFAQAYMPLIQKHSFFSK